MGHKIDCATNSIGQVDEAAEMGCTCDQNLTKAERGQMQTEVSPLFVVYVEYYAGIPSWYAAEVLQETDKTIKIKINHSKPYSCYRSIINKKHDKYIIVKSEIEVLERLKIYREARKEYENALDKFKRITEQIVG